MDETTQHGFKFGPLEVIRACHDDRLYTLIIRTDHQEVLIHSTAKGRKIYVQPPDRFVATRSKANRASKP
jgi:hypothetical protein